MKKYFCPECKGILNPTQGITLLGQREKQRGLFVFDPQPGVYDYRIDTTLKIDPGEVWDFFCPICHVDLKTHFDSRLSHLRLSDEGAEFVVLFSKVANERATFLLSPERIEAYGHDFTSYIELSLQKHYW